jgi:hypothetical protein
MSQLDFGVWTIANPVLAQATPAPASPGQAIQESARQGADYAQNLFTRLVDFLPNLLGAIVILLIGLLIAFIASRIVGGILKRTNLDNRLAANVAGSDARGTTDLPKIEDLISSLVFWVIVLFTVVAVLQALNLPAVAGPLNQFLNGIVGFLPNLVGAAVLAGVAWVVATVVKLLVTRALQAMRFDERLGQQPRRTGVDRPVGDRTVGDRVNAANTTPGTMPQEQASLSETVGNVLYWFIFLLFLLPILDTLNLNQALQPIQDLISRIVSSLPNILMAALIGFGGWFLAKIVKQIVTNFLVASGADQLGAQFGLQTGRAGQSLSSIVGTLVYVLILIPTAISALQALNIRAISDPAISMLDQVFNTLPQIFTAVLVLGLGYVAGKFVGDLVSNILTSIGFNNVFQWLGIQSSPFVPRARTTTPGEPLIQESDLTQVPTSRTPSEIVGIVVLVGIMLFATVAATNILNIPALTLIVSGLLLIAGQILVGLVIFAVGLFLANLAFSVITSSGSAQSRLLGQTARIAIIALVSAMALQQMGIATNIVNLAFGLLLGAISVAIALAFGLGGRDVAADQLREWLQSFKQRY